MVRESVSGGRRFRLGIRTQYVLVVVVSILVVASVLMVTGYLQARRALVEMASQQMRQVSAAVDESMDRFFSPAVTAAEVLGLSSIQDAPPESRASEFFGFAEAIMRAKPEIFAIKVGLDDGTLLRTVRADPEVIDLARMPENADTPFVFVAAMLALVPFVARYVAKPIERLTGIAVAVDHGGLDKAEPHPGSIIREIDEAGRAFNRMVAGLREKEFIRDLFGKYVPAQVAAAVIAEKGALRPASTECTILYADLEGFTAMAESIPPREVVDVLNAYFTAVTSIIEARGGVVTQFQGDAILATFNVPVADPRHASNAVDAAVAIQRALDEQRFASRELHARIGVNTGEVVAGNVGAQGRFNYTVHGDAVNTAARLEQLNKEYGTRILVSETTRHLSGDPRLRPIGEIAIRGKTKKLAVFCVDYRTPAAADTGAATS